MANLTSSKVAIDSFVSALRLKNKEKPIQFLKLAKEIMFSDTSRGRFTTLIEGAIGYILNEEEVVILPNTTWEKKLKMRDEMMNAYDHGQIYALVEGYPCSLQKDEYALLDKQPLHCIGELI